MDKNTARNASIHIGNRVKSARMLSGHTRSAFSKISNISMATLRAWEEPAKNRRGLTQKGTARLVSALNACDIYCTADWLCFGKGPGPQLIHSSQLLSTDDNAVTWGEEEAILKDIESFKENNPDPIVAIVTDGAMQPLYNYGGYVGGNKKYGAAIKDLIGLHCIIELENQKVIRRISMINANNHYTLTALNHDPTVTNTVITHVEIIAAAQIVWYRCSERIKDIIV